METPLISLTFYPHCSKSNTLRNPLLILRHSKIRMIQRANLMNVLRKKKKNQKKKREKLREKKKMKKKKKKQMRKKKKKNLNVYLKVLSLTLKVLKLVWRRLNGRLTISKPRTT